MGLFEGFQSHFARLGNEILRGSAAKSSVVESCLAIDDFVVTIGSLPSLANPEIGPSNRLGKSPSRLRRPILSAMVRNGHEPRGGPHLAAHNSSTY